MSEMHRPTLLAAAAKFAKAAWYWQQEPPEALDADQRFCMEAYAEAARLLQFWAAADPDRVLDVATGPAGRVCSTGPQ